MVPKVEVVELSPLKVATLLWRPRPEATVLTVICKATYELKPGVAPLAEAQDDVNERDLHTENNPNLGLYSASDLAPYKPHADVTVVGKAFAPPRELSRSLIARVRVGTVDKRIEVHAGRYILRDGRLSDDEFFSKMALGYERAPGGPNTANPVGVSLAQQPDEQGRIVVPNLQRTGESVTGVRSKLSPVGLGPIPASWPTRQRLLAGKQAGWLDGEPLEHEVPANWNWAFFNVAPKDQQLDEIQADEHIHLEQLHPEEPALDTQLPGNAPCVYVECPNGAKRATMKGDTLWIDTNRLVQTLTWRGQVTLDEPCADVRVLVAMISAGQELSWDQVWHMAEIKSRLPEADIAKRERKQKPVLAPVSARAPLSPRGTPISRREAKVTPLPSQSPRVTSPVPLVPSSDHSPDWLPSPSSSGAPPASNQGEPSAPSALTLELALDDNETQMLRELCTAMGYDAVDMLRHALREAHAARFG